MYKENISSSICLNPLKNKEKNIRIVPNEHFLPFLCIYAKKKRIFMNKNAFLVGRGGFEAHHPF